MPFLSVRNETRTDGVKMCLWKSTLKLIDSSLIHLRRFVTKIITILMFVEYTCVCVRGCAHLHVCTLSVNMHARVYACAYTRVCVCVCVCVHLCTCVGVWGHLYVYVCKCETLVESHAKLHTSHAHIILKTCWIYMTIIYSF